MRDSLGRGVMAMTQVTGFALLKSASSLVAAYETAASTDRRLYQDLCRAIRPLDPRSYRGIAREPLSPLPTNDPGLLLYFHIDLNDGTYAARQRFAEVVQDSAAGNDFDEDLLADLSTAREILALLPPELRYEAVRVSRHGFEIGPETLGFDVGYWGGDHFSILADAAVTPTWHPPQPPFQDLARQLRVLNKHFLFPTPEAAAGFGDWYRTQPWAETETRPHEFCVIRIETVSASAAA
jgi:hypothetical protein